MTDERRPIIVAKIVAPFGRLGEVKALLETDYPEEFAGRKTILITDRKNRIESREVENIRFHKGAALVKLKGINDIDGAETLRNLLFAVWPEERAKLDDGQYWIDDIVGLEVVSEDGRSFGKITEVMKNPANDVWLTKTAMIPVIKDVVLSVDLAERKVLIRPMDGMEI